MKKIKIIRIIARLNIGGPAIHAVLLTEGLNKMRFCSTLISGQISSCEGDMSYYAFEKNIQPIYVKELKRDLSIFDDILALFKIYHIIKKEAPDIIHTHTAKAGTLGRIAGIFYNFSAKKRAKLIHTFHGHVFSGYFGTLKAKIFILIERFLAFFTDMIITVSNSVKDELISFRICTKHKIQVIPLGFELNKFLTIQPSSARFVHNIGIVGRLVPIKDHRLFLDSACEIIKRDPNTKTKFKIIGDGELRQSLEEYTRMLKISDYVEFLGWQKDLVKVYSELDIVALTSLNEGTPVSLIEAMASAKAVISTDVGGIPDLLGTEINTTADRNSSFKIFERGILVTTRNPYDFACALEVLLKNEELRNTLCVNARNFAEKEFTKERLVKDIEGIYGSLIS